jgi:hypothetical protein
VTGLLLAGVVAMAYLAVQVVQGFSSRGPH